MSLPDRVDLLPTSRACKGRSKLLESAYECDVDWVSRQTIARNRVTRHAFALEDLQIPREWRAAEQNTRPFHR